MEFQCQANRKYINNNTYACANLFKPAHTRMISFPASMIFLRKIFSFVKCSIIKSFEYFSRSDLCHCSRAFSNSQAYQMNANEQKLHFDSAFFWLVLNTFFWSTFINHPTLCRMHFLQKKQGSEKNCISEKKIEIKITKCTRQKGGG